MDSKCKADAADHAAPAQVTVPRQEHIKHTIHQALLHAALAYARLGLRPVPMVGKRPALRGWQAAALTDPDSITETFARARHATGIGVATGAGIFVLDLDRHRADCNGVARLAELACRHGPVPHGPQCLSPGDGAHLYLAVPPGIRVRNLVGLVPGVDVRGDGGLACVPPTQRNGVAYRWHADPWQFPIPAAPPWLIDLVRARPAQPSAPRPIRVIAGELSPYAAAALRSELQSVARAAHGTRNHALFRAAAALGELAGAGLLPLQAIEAELTEAARASGLLDDDGPIAVAKTIASGMKRGLANPRSVDGGGR